MRILSTGPSEGSVARPAPRPSRAPRRSRLLITGVIAVATTAVVASLLIAASSASLSAGAHVTSSSHAALNVAAAATSNNSTKPGAWLRLTPPNATLPAELATAAMAFDPSTNSVVLFGGCAPCATGETWSFSGGNWTNLSSSLTVAPAPRSGASLSYDPAEGALVMFGGRTSVGVTGETWEFAKGGWALLNPSGPVPAPRSDARTTYDPTLGGLLLFGGTASTGKSFGDLWVFGSGRWTELSTPSSGLPPARSGEVFQYDPGDGYDLLFGGNGACGHPCGDTWTYSGHDWTNRTGSLLSAPTPRYDAGATYDVEDNGVILFGGHGANGLRDCWTFSGSTWSNLTSLGTHSVPGRPSSAVTFDAADGYVVALGSQSGTGPTATWAFVLPLRVALLTSTASAAPGQAVELTAFVVGGLPPYRYSIDPGTGTQPSTAARIVETYNDPGAYRAALNVTDSRGVFGLDQVVLHISDLPLTVTLTVSPGTVQVGSTSTLTATVAGGRGPYQIAWSGLPASCASGSTSALTCAPQVAGDYRVTVSVTDARNVTAYASAGLVVPVPPTLGSPTGSARAAAAVSTMPIGWVLVPPLAAGLALSALGALMMWRAARRVPPPPPPRPNCYIPPDWSETPDDRLG